MMMIVTVIIIIIMIIIIITIIISIQRMWNLKCMIIPVITGATGKITKGLKKFGNHTKKTFSRFTTKDSYTWTITHNTESAAV
jgi:uncharacterized protein YpmB